MAKIELTDGTLDTVLRCTECGEEFRFNYDGGDPQTNDDVMAYDVFVDDCLEEVQAEHVCQCRHCRVEGHSADQCPERDEEE